MRAAAAITRSDNREEASVQEEEGGAGFVLPWHLMRRWGQPVHAVHAAAGVLLLAEHQVVETVAGIRIQSLSVQRGNLAQ